VREVAELALGEHHACQEVVAMLAEPLRHLVVPPGATGRLAARRDRLAIREQGRRPRADDPLALAEEGEEAREGDRQSRGARSAAPLLARIVLEGVGPQVELVHRS
jgi:hypothetical protein